MPIQRCFPSEFIFAGGVCSGKCFLICVKIAGSQQRNGDLKIQLFKLKQLEELIYLIFHILPSVLGYTTKQVVGRCWRSKKQHWWSCPPGFWISLSLSMKASSYHYLFVAALQLRQFSGTEQPD